MCCTDADFLRREVKSQFCAPRQARVTFRSGSVCLPAAEGVSALPLKGLCVYLCGAPPPQTHTRSWLWPSSLQGERGCLPALVGRGLCSGGWSCSPHNSRRRRPGNEFSALPSPLLLSPAVSWSPGRTGSWSNCPELLRRSQELLGSQGHVARLPRAHAGGWGGGTQSQVAGRAGLRLRAWPQQPGPPARLPVGTRDDRTPALLHSPEDTASLTAPCRP